MSGPREEENQRWREGDESAESNSDKRRKDRERKGMTGKDSRWTEQAEWTKNNYREDRTLQKRDGSQQDKWIMEGESHCLLFSLFGSRRPVPSFL